MDLLRGLPSDLHTDVLRASVPPSLRFLAARLPVGLDITCDLGPRGPLAFPLLKLATFDDNKLVIQSVSVADETRIVIGRSPEPNAGPAPSQVVVVIGVEGLEIAAGETAFLASLGRLLNPSELGKLMQATARKERMLTTLQAITSHMLHATDLDLALYAMLSGITSGLGLGFHRAALFQLADSGTLVGSKAIGPFDEKEAHRIWEAIAEEDRTVASLVEDYRKENYDSRFQTLVQGLEIENAQHVAPFSDALGATEPLCLKGGDLDHPVLSQLRVGSELLVAPVRAQGRPLGLILADNLYANEPIEADQVTSFGFYIDQMALVWQSLELLRKNQQLAKHDPVTGLVNRRVWQAALEARVISGELPIALLVIDIDHFKSTNDELGHAAGDALLRELASVLRANATSRDVAARFGGDEFVLLLCQQHRDDALERAQAIGNGAAERGISLSVGAARFPGSCPTPERLFDEADTQLYRAKQAGRGCLCLGNAPPIRFGDAT